MKKITFTLICSLIAIIAISQDSQSFKYQAALRDADGKIISNESVTLRISILSQSENGEVAYSEKHELSTSAQGLIALNIGEGENLSGSFESINWGANQHYLKLELNYENTGFIEMGTSQLLSVPYALYAEKVRNIEDADADPNNELQTLSISGDTIFLSNGGSIIIKNGTSFSGDYNDLTNTPNPGGDISGKIDTMQVNKIKGMEISSNIPANGQVLKWNETEQKWMPDEDGLGAAGTMDGVVSSVGIQGTSTKTMTFNRTNDLGVLTATFNDEINDADADSTNEIQTLSYINDTLYLSKGGSVKISGGNFSGSYNDLSNVPDNFDMDTTNELQKLSIIGNTLSLDKEGGNVTIPTKGWGGITDEALFAVVNKAGDTVFAVYDGGVRIYVDDSNNKPAKGGFAVASRSAAKGTTNNIFNVTGDSVRIYLNENNNKPAKGGFAVASRSASKGKTLDILNITNDSVRIYLDNAIGKPAKGGFAVASRSAAKGVVNDILNISEDSVRIYLDKTNGKPAKGGFAVASRSAAKGTAQDILSVTSDSTRIYVRNDEAGFGVENTSNGTNERLMRLIKENYFIGHQAGTNNNTGLYNTFLGYQSGIKHINGNNNIYIGYQTAFNDTSGENNIFIGHKAGYKNTSGSDNLFIGDSTGYNNTTGDGHVFLGHNAGINNTTGYQNTFVGYKSGQNNSSGYANAFLGTVAGLHNTTGFANVFIGPYAGHFNTTGRENVFIGLHCGQSNTEGYYNTFVGKTSGAYNTTGIVNTFLGFDAGLHNTTGDGNTFLGASTGNFNTTGSNNTFIGNGAGAHPANSAPSTGSGNVFVGASAGFNTIGDSNIFIGNFAGYEKTGSNLLYIDNSNTSTPLIYGNFTNGLEQVEINGNFVVKQNFWVEGTAGGNAAWNDFSDKRLKKNITTIPNALNRIKLLRGVNYEWKDTLHPENGNIKMGFIAQEALEVIPEVVNKNGEYYSMQYASITAILVEATKEQQKLIEEQNKTINSQAKELEKVIKNYETLKAELDELKQLISKMNK